MDCPQCGAEVPSDDAFCGKCGYAMRDHGPDRLDQSRIRVHEEPDPTTMERPSSVSSQQRIRKHTVLGMPSLPAAAGRASSATPPPPPPTSLPSARSESSRKPQKTMIGIPRSELLEPQLTERPEHPAEIEPSTPAAGESGARPEPAVRSHRVRARVRYDSANEPLSVTQRRRKALRSVAVLVLLAACWLGYRLLTVNG